MKARFGISVLAIAALVVFGLTGAVYSDTVVFSDDFPGTALSADWVASTGDRAPTVLNSEVSLKPNDAAESSWMATTSYWGYGTTSFTIGANWWDLASYAGQFGVATNGSTQSAYVVGSETSWQFLISAGSSNVSIPIDQPLAGELWEIGYSASSINLKRDGTQIATDSTLPFSADVRPLLSYYGNKWYPWNFDKVEVSTTIPEPSTLVLLVTGLFGLMAYAWRKRK